MFPSLMPAEQTRISAIQQARLAYEGLLPEPLKVRDGEPNDNVRVNRCAPIVDKGVQFLFGDQVPITIENAPDGWQDCLDGCWGGSDAQMTTLTKLATNGGITGHAFLQIVPPAPERGYVYPRLIVLDPSMVNVWTDPTDCSVALSYTVTYTMQDATGQALTRRFLAQRIGHDGQMVTLLTMTTTDTWQVQYQTYRQGAWMPDHDPTPWPFPFSPILDCQNLPNANEYWGRPDLTPDLIEMNRVLNFIESNLSRVIKIFASPVIAAKGMNADQISMTPGRVITLPSPNASIEMIQSSGDIAGMLQYAANLRADMDEQSGVPGVALGRHTDLPKGTISGVALQVLYAPLIKKTVLKRRLYGSLIVAASRAMLALCGYDSTDYDIQLQWTSMLPGDDTAEVQTALLKQQIGVSKTTLLTELGYDPDAEQEKADAEGAHSVQAVAQGKALPTGNDGPVTAPDGQPDASGEDAA